MVLSLTASFSAFGIVEQPALISPQFVGTPGIDDIPFCIDEDVITDAEHTVRLRYLETEDNVAAFSNPDGSATMYYFSNPIKYTDIYGNTVDIDNTVETFGELTDEYKFKTKSAPATTYLPATIGMGEDVKVEHNGFSVQIIPMSDRFAAGTTVASELKTGKDSAVLYSNVFGTGRSLKYTTLYNGVKEDIILNSYVANANSFNFIVKTNGLELAEIDGRYVFRDTLGIPMFELSPIFVYDSAEVPNTTGGTYAIEEIKPNDIYALTLTVDETWLSGATYPVTIDPTVTYDENNGIEDAYSPSAGSGLTGYEHQLIIGDITDVTSPARTYIRFPNLVNTLEMDSDLIDLAKLHLTVSATTTQTSTISVHHITSSWIEYHWSGYYPYNTFELSTAASKDYSISGTGSKEFIITPFVRRFVDNDYLDSRGLLIKFKNESLDEKIIFYSSEATDTSKRPYLTVVISAYSVPTAKQEIIRDNRFYWVSDAGLYITEESASLGKYPDSSSPDYTALNQRLLFTHVEGGKYKISTELSPNYFLTLQGETLLFQKSDNLSADNLILQYWYIGTTELNNHFIISASDTSKSLAINSDGVYVTTGTLTSWSFEKCPTFYGQQMSIIEGYEYWDGSELDKVKFIYSGDYSGKSLLLENSNEDALFAGCTSVAYSMILDNLGVKANVRDFRYDRGNDTSPKWRPVDPFYMALANTGHLLTSVNTVDPRLDQIYSSSRSPVAVRLPSIDINGISHPDTRFSEIIELDRKYNKDGDNNSMIYELIDELEEHPEGVYVYFKRNGNVSGHAIVFTKYIGGKTLDSTPENDFIVYDPAARSHQNGESGSGVLFSNCKTYRTSGTYMLTFDQMEYFISIKLAD